MHVMGNKIKFSSHQIADAFSLMSFQHLPEQFMYFKTIFVPSTCGGAGQSNITLVKECAALC